MAKDEPLRPAETPLDRFMRFGTALFAVRKAELPARDEHEPKRPRKKAKPAS